MFWLPRWLCSHWGASEAEATLGRRCVFLRRGPACLQTPCAPGRAPQRHRARGGRAASQPTWLWVPAVCPAGLWRSRRGRTGPASPPRPRGAAFASRGGLCVSPTEAGSGQMASQGHGRWQAPSSGPASLAGNFLPSLKSVTRRGFWRKFFSEERGLSESDASGHTDLSALLPFSSCYHVRVACWAQSKGTPAPDSLGAAQGQSRCGRTPALPRGGEEGQAASGRLVWVQTCSHVGSAPGPLGTAEPGLGTTGISGARNHWPLCLLSRHWTLSQCTAPVHTARPCSWASGSRSAPTAGDSWPMGAGRPGRHLVSR